MNQYYWQSESIGRSNQISFNEKKSAKQRLGLLTTSLKYPGSRLE